MKRILQFALLLALLAWCAPTQAQIAYAGRKAEEQVTSATVTLTYNGTSAVGNWLYAFSGHGGAHTLTATSNCSGALTMGTASASGTNRTNHGWAVITSAQTPCVVTGTWSGSGANVSFGLEVSGTDGIDGTNHVCSSQTSPGTGTDAITSTAKTSTTVNLVAGATWNFDGNALTITQGTGFTKVDDFTGGFRGTSEYLVQGGAGSQAATFTTSANSGFSTCMAMFKPVAGGSTFRTQVGGFLVGP